MSETSNLISLRCTHTIDTSLIKILMLKLTYIHLKRMKLCWLWMNQNNNITCYHGDNNDMILKIFQKRSY